MNITYTLTFALRRHWMAWSYMVVLVGILAGSVAQAQTGNYVFSGAEAVNYGVVDLATPGGQTWATDRGATPGYFSAVGTASYTGASDAANVNGYVKHYATAANQSFTFTVGSGTDYRALSVSGTRSASSVIGVAWIVGDPSTTTDPTAPNAGTHAITSVGTGITAVSPAGMWDWQDVTGNAAGLTVTVSLPNLSSFGLAGNLRLVGWNGTQWVNLSGSTGASGNTENSPLSGTMISGITALGVGLSNSCPNPTVGGTATYAGGTLCDVSNAGTITLSGQTGTVVKWQTSTNGGANWTDIAGTFGKTLYSFVNAANGQQFRAVLNNAGSCSDAFSAPATISTSPTACSSATCDKSSGTVSFTVTPASTGSNYSHVIIMTNSAGVIQYASAPGSSTLTNVAVGNYLTYLVSYDNTQSPLPTLTVGTSLSAIGGACVAYSSQLAVKVCPSVVFNCASISVAGSFIVGTPSSGTLTVPITGAQAGPFSLTLTGTGFASVPSPFVTTLTASQTAISIPFTYDGSGVASVRSLSLSSAQANNSCTPTVNVLPFTPCIALTPGQVIPGAPSVLTGGATSFSYVGASAGSSVRWYVAPSITASPSSGTGTVTPAITFLNAGYYQIIFEETNSSIPVGCNVPNTVQSTLDYLVNAPVNPCASPGSSTVVTSPSTAAIVIGGTGSFTLVGGQPYNNVQWQIIPATGASPNTGSGAITPSITFSQEGLYRIVYTMTNAGDLTCTPVQKVSSGLISVGLNPCAAPSPISVINAAGLQTTQVGTTTTFNAIGGIPGTMTWKVYPTTGVSSVSGTGSSATLTFTQAGNYIVTFISSNSSLPLGCTKPVATAGSTSIQVVAPAIVVTPDIANTKINTPVSGNVLTNDTDPAGNPLTASVTTQPTAGTVTMTPTGSYTYTPPTGFTGVVTFCYTATSTLGVSASTCVTINVLPDPSPIGNNPPVANNDATQTTAGTPVTVAVLANDTDPDSATTLNGQLNTPTLVSQPSAGTAVVNANGTVTYTPPANFTGVVSFPYQVCDKATPALCTTALVSVNVQPTPPANTTLAPVAVDDALITLVNTAKTGTVASNDSDPQGLPLTYTTGQPSSGTVVMSPTGSYTYTPAPGYTGPASFTYAVCNSANKCDVATVSILVQAPATPVVVLKLKVLLQGALVNNTSSLMRDDLRSKKFLPLLEPYTAIGGARFTHVNGGGGETMPASVTGLNIGTGDAVVDWVFVELRNPANLSAVVATRSALVQRDGDVVLASDGVSPLSFSGLSGSSFYVSVKHRNHLGAMTATAIPLSLTGTIVDFTTMTASQLYNTVINAFNYDGWEQITVNGKQALWAGDANHNGKVKYQGANNDLITIFSEVIAAQPTNPNPLYNYDNALGYYFGDVNMDGKVKYQGTTNDTSLIFTNVITNYQTTTQMNSGQLYNFDFMLEQIP
ncbi:Ig-like domain-containing protein [Spirosoma aerophilum]